MFLLIMFLLAAVLCGAAGWGLEKAEGGVQAGRFLRRALWPLGAICLMLPFLARSFSPGDLLQAAAALPLGAGLLAAVQACFVLRRSRTGKKAGVLAAAALVLGCLFLELVPFQVNYWASRNYTPSELLISENRGASYLGEDQTTVEIAGIDIKAKNLRISYTPSDSLWYKTISANVSVYDSAFGNRILNIQEPWRLYKDNESSYYYNLNLDGNLQGLLISFPHDTDIIIDSIQANVPRPFCFSWVRLCVLFLTLMFLWNLRPHSILWEVAYLEKTRAQKWYCRLFVFAILICYVLISACTPYDASLKIRGINKNDGSLISWNSDSDAEVSKQYPLLVESLLHGNFALEIEPDPKLQNLENPYDIKLREEAGADYRFDTAYYNGKYYVYFGIIPVLLFYLPYYFVTGHHLNSFVVCLICAILFLIGVVYFLQAIIRRWFPHTSMNAFIMGFLAISMLSSMPLLIKRPDIYEVPIAMALMLIVWGSAIWIHASENCKNRRIFFLLGGLLLALSVGCRPQFALYSFIIFPLFGKEYIIEKKLFTKQGALDFVCMVLPYVPIAIGLMLYNAVRFNSPFDFGATYNLTVLDMRIRKWQPSRILQGIWNYFISVPSYKAVFPFLLENSKTAFHGHTSANFVFGGLFTSRPFLLLYPIGIVFAKDLKAKKFAGLWLYCGLTAFIIMSVDVLMSDTLQRYSADFAILLVLGSLISFFLAESSVQNIDGRSVMLFRGIIVILLSISVINSLLSVAVGEADWTAQNPMLFFNMRHLLMFWA